MSESQKYIQEEPTNNSVEKSKSQNGGSTTLSQGTNEIDEQFKVRQGQKFQFINENVKEWPQWSIDKKQQEKKNIQDLNKIQEIIEIQQHQLNKIQFYNRGVDFSVNFDSAFSLQNKPKKSFPGRIVDKIKGWFK